MQIEKNALEECVLQHGVHVTTLAVFPQGHTTCDQV
jgi:hypothetical protein